MTKHLWEMRSGINLWLRGLDSVKAQIEDRRGAAHAQERELDEALTDMMDEHVERIKPYIELGFRHLVFHAPGPDQERFLRLYAKEVLPRLRRL